ncbi:uncharacterized protein LY79DRAFT_540406, partial [Colletotrichum navitas]
MLFLSLFAPLPPGTTTTHTLTQGVFPWAKGCLGSLLPRCRISTGTCQLCQGCWCWCWCWAWPGPRTSCLQDIESRLRQFVPYV